MWGQVAADSGFYVMAYDVPSGTTYDPGEKPFFLSLRGETADEVTVFWEKLSEGRERCGAAGAGAARAPLRNA